LIDLSTAKMVALLRGKKNQTMVFDAIDRLDATKTMIFAYNGLDDRVATIRGLWAQVLIQEGSYMPPMAQTSAGFWWPA
jgi:hypothetical protein